MSKKLILFALILSLLINLKFIYNHFAYGVPRPSQDSTDYRKSIADRAILIDGILTDSLATIFIGDSQTELFRVSEMFNSFYIKNRGIIGSTSWDLVERMPAIVKSHPSKIFIQIGINDLKNSLRLNEGEKQLLTDYETMLYFISKQSPRTKVYVQNLPPVNKMFFKERTDSINKIIPAVNGEIKNTALKYNDQYVDLYKLFNDKGILPARFSADGLHLDAAGYKIWKKEIEKFVN